MKSLKKEYETTWVSPEEVSDVSIELSEQKLCQVNENGEWEECKDGKISLRKLTNKACQEDGRFQIVESIKTSVDHLPIDRMVETIKINALRSAKNGTNTAYASFISIYQNDITERQEYKLLNVLYSKLSDIFTDTLELSISWTYDGGIDESFMIIDIKW